MTKAGLLPTRALGFRVKSGWAAAVLLADSAKGPRILDRRRIELADPQIPGSSQPYHASMGKLQTDESKIERLRQVVFRVTKQSIKSLMTELQLAGYCPASAGLVVGSEMEPDRIANSHIRAHALEGQLFRTALAKELESTKLACTIFLERTLYTEGSARLRISETELKRKLAQLGRGLDVPWRGDEKAACLAAWLCFASAG